LSTVRYRKGAGGDGPKISFAFFLAGALVVLVAVFVIGIQVGRVIEKEKIASPPPGEEGTQVVKLSPTDGPAATEPLPAGSPPFPVEAGKEHAPITFPETLEKSEPVVVPLPKEKEPSFPPAPEASQPPRKAEKAEKGGKGAKPEEGAAEEGKGRGGKEIFLQAGVFTDKFGAETVRKKIRRAGYESTLRPAEGKGGKTLHKVLAGPFPDRAAARKAERKLKGAGVDVYLPRG
jgi:cell division protein FtsN